jgi:UDP-2,4-diacetamido-2,4,6-trideoxy-beta-L-altropyranose hydrolase
MSIFIRVDSSTLIGFGHVYRMLNLAKHLELRLGEKPTFICRPLAGNIINHILKHSFAVIELSHQSKVVATSGDYSTWLETTEDDESNELIKIVEKYNIKKLIIDHYSIGESIEIRLLRSGVKSLLVVDDIERKHRASFLLDQNFTTSPSEKYKLSIVGHKFIGQQYCLLSTKLSRMNPIAIKENIRTITIFFGGSDISGTTLGSAREVVSYFPQYKFNVIIGSTYPQRSDLENVLNRLHNVKLHVQTEEMEEILMNTDLCIASAGVNTWERAFLGVPMLCISTADNQKNVARELASIGGLCYLGHYDEIDWPTIRETVMKFDANKILRERMHDVLVHLGIGKRIDFLVDQFVNEN